MPLRHCCSCRAYCCARKKKTCRCATAATAVHTAVHEKRRHAAAPLLQLPCILLCMKRRHAAAPLLQLPCILLCTKKEDMPLRHCCNCRAYCCARKKDMPLDSQWIGWNRLKISIQFRPIELQYSY